MSNKAALEIEENDFRKTGEGLATMPEHKAVTIEMAAEKAGFMNRLPSIRSNSFRSMDSSKRPSFAKLDRGASFVRGLFSGSTKKVGVLDVDDKDDEENKSENNDEMKQITNGEGGDDSDDEEAKRDFYDPPLPILGFAGDVEKMFDRNAKAELGLTTLLSLVKRETDESIGQSKNMPVSEGLDRVVVTEEINTFLDRTTTRAQINENTKKNYIEIQKALNFRKSGIIMMNSNYSKVLVRKIEPIYIQETRSIITHKK